MYKSESCDVTIRETPDQVRMLSPYTGQLERFFGKDQWLAAGQGVLLKVDYRWL